MQSFWHNTVSKLRHLVSTANWDIILPPSQQTEWIPAMMWNKCNGKECRMAGVVDVRGQNVILQCSIFRTANCHCQCKEPPHQDNMMSSKMVTSLTQALLRGTGRNNIFPSKRLWHNIELNVEAEVSGSSPCGARLRQLKSNCLCTYVSITNKLDLMIAICLINELIKMVQCLQRDWNTLGKHFHQTVGLVPSQPSVNFN